MLSAKSTKIALSAVALIVFGILPNATVAQNSHGKEFHRLFHQADSLFDLGQYTAAGQLCDQALEMKGGMSSYAFLQDRVLMRRGQRQRYGTQIAKHPVTGKSAFYPVEDPIHIDTIRASVGFEPIKEYAAFIEIEITSPDDLDDQRVLEDWQERRN